MNMYYASSHKAISPRGGSTLVAQPCSARAGAQFMPNACCRPGDAGGRLAGSGWLMVGGPPAGGGNPLSAGGLSAGGAPAICAGGPPLRTLGGAHSSLRLKEISEGDGTGDGVGARGEYGTGMETLDQVMPPMEKRVTVREVPF